MSGGAVEEGQPSGTFSAPATLPASGIWTGSLSPYGKAVFYRMTARADRTMTFKVTATNSLDGPTEDKAQPVIGVWQDADPEGSVARVASVYFNGADTGTTVLHAQFLLPGEFKLGVADYRGDGRPDFRYRARLFYADTVSPVRASITGGTTLTIA